MIGVSEESLPLDLFDARANHKQFVLTQFSAQAAYDAPVIVRAEGVAVYGEDGRRYIDASSGLVAVNLGHGHPGVIAAIQEQSQRVCYVSPWLFNDRRAEYARRLVEISPWKEGGRVFFSLSGSCANEDAVRMARACTGRDKVLTQYRSFHGATPGAGIFTGEMRRWANEPGIPGVVHFWGPHPYRSPFDTTDPGEETRRALGHLRSVIKAEDPDRIATVLLEPMVGATGIVVYPPGYLQGVRDLCDEFGILLIFDEVLTGFGRTGAAFAGERQGIVPDLITMAKGMTSAYIPLGGVMVREQVATYFDDHVMWVGHTFSGHPLATAVGIAVLDAYQNEGIFNKALSLEATLRAKLRELQQEHEVIGDVRGMGALFGIEFVSNRESRTPLATSRGGSDLMAVLYAGLRKRGVIAFGRFNVACIAPPLIASGDDIDEIVTALDGAIGDLSRAVGTSKE